MRFHAAPFVMENRPLRLEHFSRLKPALQEIGRVVSRDGAVCVAVPDPRTITDRLYRKLCAGAGG
jgi:ubiquinone/menaquinone biosynthesis C-methylase UbiE